MVEAPKGKLTVSMMEELAAAAKALGATHFLNKAEVIFLLVGATSLYMRENDVPDYVVGPFDRFMSHLTSCVAALGWGVVDGGNGKDEGH